MNLDEVTYIEDLIFTTLAQHRGVNIPTLGSLRCVLQSTTTNQYKEINEIPKYVIEVSAEYEGDSVVQLMVNHANCERGDAQEMFDEWFEFIHKREDEVSVYTISNVGVIIRNVESLTFKEDKELALLLNPLQVIDVSNQEKTPLASVELNVEEPHLVEDISNVEELSLVEDVSNEKKVLKQRVKRRITSLRVVSIIIIIFVIGVITYVIASFVLTRNNDNKYHGAYLTTVDKESINNRGTVDISIINTLNNDYVEDEVQIIDSSIINSIQSAELATVVDTTNNRVVSKEVQIIDSNTINSVQSVDTVIAERAVKTHVMFLKSDSLKQYHIIASASSKKDRAIEYFNVLILTEKEVYLFETDNKKVPYYLSVGRYKDFDSADRQLKIYKENNLFNTPWIFKY